jgi:hypothetical protein
MSSYTLPASSLRTLLQSLYLLVLSISGAYCLFDLATLSVTAAPSTYIYLHFYSNIPCYVSPLVWFNRLEK